MDQQPNDKQLPAVNEDTLPQEIKDRIKVMRDSGIEVTVVSAEALSKMTMTPREAQLHEMAMLYRNAGYQWMAIAKREARRFYISVGCNAVLLGVLWFA